MYSIALFLHVAATVIWLGAVFFAAVLLDPVLGTIDHHQRLRTWELTLKKLFPWIWLCIVVLLVTGFYMIYDTGGFSTMPVPVTIMLVAAVIMIILFRILFVVPFPHLGRGIREQKWEVADFALGTIHKLMAAILVIGGLTLFSATALPWLN